VLSIHREKRARCQEHAYANGHAGFAADGFCRIPGRSAGSRPAAILAVKENYIGGDAGNGTGKTAIISKPTI